MLARADPTMAAFEQWVRQRIPEPLQVSAAARDLGISERTLQRTTASVVGMSPLHFIQQVRLDEATYLLRDTSMSANAIAAAVGYRNAGTLRALVRKTAQQHPQSVAGRAADLSTPLVTGVKKCLSPLIVVKRRLVLVAVAGPVVVGRVGVGFGR
jgi:transcriptional regulator GlxA family with amidase domain